MPRPRKCRRVCQMPRTGGFRPVFTEETGETVLQDEEETINLTVDEYEAIRLIDREGMSQEECSAYMQVARTTAQLIYNSARKKLADALVMGLPLRIQGGNFRICDGSNARRDCDGCRRRLGTCVLLKEKGDGNMRIAIPLDENKEDVCIVLGRAPYFLFRENGEDTILENPAAQSEGGAGLQAAQFLIDNSTDVLVTVRCGQNAGDVFREAGIKIYKSANKAAADDLAALEAGTLGELTQFHGGFHGVK